jgi:hypothetical protein
VLRKKGPAVAAILAGALLLSAFGTWTKVAAAAAPSPAAADIPPTPDLYIYDPSGTKLLGRAHYTVTRHDDLVTINGRNDFVNGEHDIERDTLRTAPGDVPRMRAYEHIFFDAHGAVQIVARANTATGKCSCANYENSKGTIETAMLEFPPDTYAGAGVLVSIADRLRRGSSIDLDIHVFECADGPRIMALHADLARAPWSYRPYDGEFGKADARPVFGWFNIFLKPFVPTIRLWFDPRQDFAFVGGMVSRYYRGPEVLLVSSAPPVKPRPVFKRASPPAFTAPQDSATLVHPRQ